MHAPNRNPAEASFAAVDKRLSSSQRKSALEIIENFDYAISHYWFNEGDRSISLVDTDCYYNFNIKFNGNVEPIQREVLT